MPKIQVVFRWEPEDFLKSIMKGQIDDDLFDCHFPPFEKEEESKLNALAEVFIGWKYDEEVLDEAKNLKLIINPGAGVQHFQSLIPKLKEKKVILTNCHDHANLSAQHGMALLLNICRQIRPHDQWMRAGKWRTRYEAGKGVNLEDRTIGFLGYGAINKTFHNYLKPYGSRFAALKRSWDYTPENMETYLPEELESFLKYVDILLLALPLTPKTTGIIGEKELKLLGPEGLLVNLGRGLLIQEEELYQSLKEEGIRAAAIDVWYEYNPQENDQGQKFPFSKPFHELENILLSPHRAGTPDEDPKRWIEMLKILKQYGSNKMEAKHIVNLEEGY